ncbi:hypothetical protein DBR17_19100 [Sphingomonas sp. HMWF008]|nr:hypothetical protein DBR17_19100 [Sphingomonas sp. HMWF008]
MPVDLDRAGAHYVQAALHPRDRKGRAQQEQGDCAALAAGHRGDGNAAAVLDVIGRDGVNLDTRLVLVRKLQERRAIGRLGQARRHRTQRDLDIGDARVTRPRQQIGQRQRRGDAQAA